MKILTEFSEEEDEEIGVNEDVNSKSDDACDIYINDYDNHIISEIYFIIIVEKQKNRRSLKHKYKCDQEGCGRILSLKSSSESSKIIFMR